jgi:membrane-associated protease RseP (regulator of RpoE activity)
MNTKLNTMYIATLAAFITGGCLGPNPWLKKCGQSWTVVAKGAMGEHPTGELIAIEQNGQPTSASVCYNDAQSETILNPESVEYMAIRSSALAECQKQAAVMGLVSENCEESLTEPANVGTCVLSEAQCSAPDETGETGESGITKGNLGNALGFQNGDVVTEVGGEPFDSWNAVLDAANGSFHASTVEVVFIRDNRVLTRRYSRI